MTGVAAPGPGFEYWFPCFHPELLRMSSPQPSPQRRSFRLQSLNSFFRESRESTPLKDTINCCTTTWSTATYSHIQRHLRVCALAHLVNAHQQNYKHAGFTQVPVGNNKKLMWRVPCLLVSVWIQSPTNTCMSNEYKIFWHNEQAFGFLLAQLFC